MQSKASIFLPLLAAFSIDAGNRRRVVSAAVQQSDLCRICAFPGSELLGEKFVPWATTGDGSSSLLDAVGQVRDSTQHDGVLANAAVGSNETERTCEEWQARAAAEAEAAGGPSSSASCLDLIVRLEHRCCRGLPPLYECESAVEESLLLHKQHGGSHYTKDRAPIVGTPAYVDVAVRFDASAVRIADYGVDGGAVDVSGTLRFGWVDGRLAWNATAAGCASMTVSAGKIWVPALRPAVRGDGRRDESSPEGDSRARVTADGRVRWSRRGSVRVPCESRAGGSAKRCSVDLEGDADGGVRFSSNGIVVVGGDHDNFSIPEYRLNETGSSLVATTERGGRQDVRVVLDFVPKVNECNICGHHGAELRNGTIRVYPLPWLQVFPDTEGWTCLQIDGLMKSVDVKNTSCLDGRAAFEEVCCDDVRSSYECESDIHDQMVERHNTITPPDPSPLEDDRIFASKDVVDVQVSLDFAHILGIDIKTNSMEMLVSLDLNWYESRLAWDPFTGGCHRVTYRASLDAELTEIWVPNIELVNKIAGVQELPEAHASVRYDGHVWWRRTGILHANCDLSGINRFPFDTSSCYLDFGGTRDPLYHRVKYRSALEYIEYSDRVQDESWNYQEYKLDYSKTEVVNRIETLSGYENELIRFQFFFRRAQTYYINLFVLLYIFFTYLSFGMFYVDYQMGERLGYGSSMLFVLVAQDITLSESTPVTQEFLWIYKLSFGSKIFVIVAIVQSITVLFIYSHINLVVSHEHAGDGRDLESSGNLEERQAFINDGSGANRAAADVSVEDNSAIQATDGGSDKSVAEPGAETKKGSHWRLQRSRWCLPLISCISRYNPKPWDSETTTRLKQLRIVDLSFGLFFFLAYSVFVIIMFCIL